MHFELDERLKADTILLATILEYKILLNKDSRFPWIILVPKVNGLSEMHHLSYDLQANYLKISNLMSKVLHHIYSPHKINIASLGNIVKQLHIHHVARFEYDEAWPGPIWGVGQAIPYSQTELEHTCHLFKKIIEDINQGELNVNYHN